MIFELMVTPDIPVVRGDRQLRAESLYCKYSKGGRHPYLFTARLFSNNRGKFSSIFYFTSCWVGIVPKEWPIWFWEGNDSERETVIQPVSTLRNGDTKLVPRVPANFAPNEQEWFAWTLSPKCRRTLRIPGVKGHPECYCKVFFFSLLNSVVIFLFTIEVVSLDSQKCTFHWLTAPIKKKHLINTNGFFSLINHLKSP